MKMRAGIVFLLLAQGLAGCGGSKSSPLPSAPSSVSRPVPQPTPPLNNAGVVVKGTVVDTANRYLAGAIVEVVNGPQAGTSAIADATGQFSLAGTFNDTTLFRATKAGRVTATRPWERHSSGPYLLFSLAVLAPPASIAGDYNLTFVADPACAAALPVELRTRTYAATISPGQSANVPVNTGFWIAVSGASFDSYYNWFSVGVAGDYLAFWLRDEHLVELLAADRYLELSGVATASVGTSGVSTISASFDGVFGHCERKSIDSVNRCNSGQAVLLSQCESKNHQLILTRR
jgi:hypothetical protein